MDDVFLSEVDLNGHEDWATIGAGEVSLLPGCTEGDTDILAVQIDITSPFSTLKTVLQQKLGIDFSNCELWLQDTLQLSEESTLSEQCIQGEGLVQVNLELKSDQGVIKINILDVLKPPDDGPAEVVIPTKADSPETVVETTQVIESMCEIVPTSAPEVPGKGVHPVPVSSSNGPSGATLASSSIGTISPAVPAKVPIANSRNLKPLANTANENITRWVMDSGFRKDQDRLKIPLDPVMWTQVHVQHWINWAIKQFNLKSVNPSKWSWIDGPALCTMSHADFTEKVPNDPNDLFWTHLELLRKCKFVGVIQKPVPYLQYVTTPLTVKSDSAKSISRSANPKSSPTKVVQSDANAFSTTMIGGGNRTGSNGQVQLWQFLLELLTDKNFRSAISWLGTGGEFKLNNPELVAQLWGERKNKPNMNYEKLSRALRYYYDGDMICKVSGKRFVYKFVCDLKQLLGYSADELNKLVIECEQRSKTKRDPFYMC